MTNREMYLSFVNDFLTVARFAEYYGVSKIEAFHIIGRGRLEHETTTGTF